MTATNKELQQVPATGLGHQFKKGQKALNVVKATLQTAYIESYGIGDDAAIPLRNEIIKLINQCNDLSYSANEKFNQND